jgi:citrate lyase beta subunit
VQSADDVRCIDAELCAIEGTLSLSHRLCIIPWIETARGVMNAASICSASPRVAAVAFGAEDFARDLQLPNEVRGKIWRERAVHMQAKCVNRCAGQYESRRAANGAGACSDGRTLLWSAAPRRAFCQVQGQVEHGPKSRYSL